MKPFIFTTVFIVLFSISTIAAQGSIPGVAILDLSERNDETNDARLFSVEHTCKVVGVPFIITQDPAIADNYKMVFCTSALREQTFSEEEEGDLIDYVNNGGLLLAPRVEDEDLFELFGVDGYTPSNARYTMTWDNTNPVNDKVLRWINEPEEQTISLGRDTYDAIYKTLGYSPTTATALAHFVDGTAAAVWNNYGDGKAVTIGISIKEIVLRNQINRDYEAQRISSNGFEPTSDAFFLFVRGLYTDKVPYTVWKHTSPGNSAATVMVTHDIDSSTGMDTLRNFVDYQKNNNIEATYNVTVRYFDDELMSPFYLDQQNTMEYIKNNGQSFGSHSVGHFFDFADEDVFPIGEPGNTQSDYNPYNDGDITVGGTVYGECGVSKNVLEEDINVAIRTFRAGHLAYPKYLVDVLEDLGYEYNTTHSAADVLTNFPYQNKKGRSFSGARSSVYELPVTISDVFHSDPISITNYLDKANIWLDVTLKNRANGAPSVLLIHPNRGYKLAGMAYYLEALPNDIYIEEIGRFGDYWKAREALTFDAYVIDNEMIMILPEDVNLNSNVSFIVEDGQSLNGVVVKDNQNNILDFSVENWEGNDLIVFYENVVEESVALSNNILAKETLAFKAFPNPTQLVLSIEFEVDKKDYLEIGLFDAKGNELISILKEQVTAGTYKLSENLKEAGLAPGVYFIIGKTESGGTLKEKVILI